MKTHSGTRNTGKHHYMCILPLTGIVRKVTNLFVIKKRVAPAAHEWTGILAPDRIDEKVSFFSKHLHGISKKGAAPPTHEWTGISAPDRIDEKVSFFSRHCISKRMVCKKNRNI